MPLDSCPSQLRTRKFNSKAGRKHDYFLEKRDCTTRELTTTCCRSSYYLTLSLYLFGKEQNEVQTQLLSEFLLVYCSNKIKSILLRTQKLVYIICVAYVGINTKTVFPKKILKKFKGKENAFTHTTNKIKCNAPPTPIMF